ncbi:MAG TPA: ABC transporter substrate-binding protein [Micromonosporaceae bacterium]|jgi:NitT/TauT family transport system substrate-binding protein
MLEINRPRIGIRRMRHAVAIAAAALLVAATAACGSSSSGSSSGGMTTVNEGVPTSSLSNIAQDVAVEKGFFKAQGINLNVKIVSGSSAAGAAMVAGSLQFTTVSSTAVVQGRSKGVPFVMVQNFVNGLGWQMVVGKKWAADHHLSPSMPIDQRIAGLSGAKIGVTSTTDKAIFQYFFQTYHVTNTQSVQVSSSPALAAALQAGTIDAFFTPPPVSTQAAEATGGMILVNTHTIPEFQDQVYAGLVTTTNYAKQHSDIVRKVITAEQQGIAYMKANPDYAVTVAKKYFPSLSTDLITYALSQQVVADAPMTQASWDKSIALWSSVGVLPAGSTAPEGTAWTNDYRQQS